MKNGTNNIPIIMISLDEVYFNMMLSCKKKYEYRKRFIKERCIAYAYIRKQKEGVGYIDLRMPIIDISEGISEISVNANDSMYDEMISYLGAGKIRYAAEVISVTEIEPVGLVTFRNLFPLFALPQPYLYFDKKSELL